MKAGFSSELRDAVTPRAAALVLAVLGLQLAFLASYIGAFHHPKPHEIPVAVVVPGDAITVLEQLNGLPGTPLSAHLVASEAQGRGEIENRVASAVFILSGTGVNDELLVASAGGAAVSTAVTEVFTQAEQARGRTVTVYDVKPAVAGDARGLSAFYLAVGWVVGGYLVAIALGTSKGAKAANRHRALIRLLTLALYAAASGAAGTALATRVLGALSGDQTQLCWFGALLVFGAGAFTMALQAVLGLVGTGLSVLLFVVLGNPSAGGAYPPSLLPPFWRTAGPWLPPGAGTDAIRGIVYFHSVGLQRDAVLMGCYAVVGVLATLFASAMQEPRRVVLADLQTRPTTPPPVVTRVTQPGNAVTPLRAAVRSLPPGS